jgi:hypothetical protein
MNVPGEHSQIPVSIASSGEIHAIRTDSICPSMLFGFRAAGGTGTVLPPRTVMVGSIRSDIVGPFVTDKNKCRAVSFWISLS